MAEFSLEGLKKGFTGKVMEVNTKASTYMEVNRLKTYIGTLEKEMAGLRDVVGGKIYDAWKQGNGEADISIVAGELSRLLELENKIAEQNSRIQEVEAQSRQITGTAQNVRFCSRCGTACAAESAFCKNCGNKL